MNNILLLIIEITFAIICPPISVIIKSGFVNGWAHLILITLSYVSIVLYAFFLIFEVKGFESIE
jgi:uncharacterized membrane protein YqaE (UPF0057 family)